MTEATGCFRFEKKTDRYLRFGIWVNGKRAGSLYLPKGDFAPQTIVLREKGIKQPLPKHPF